MFGVFAPGHDVARLSYFALYALQHRGQESAGIATAQGGHIMAMRDQGLVNQVFDEQKLRALQGDMALGHVRYSTTGANSWENSQPVWRADRREVALGHNGNLVNAVELHTELRERGVSFRSTSDSEIIAALLSTHPAERSRTRWRTSAAPRGRVLDGRDDKDRVVAFRDPAGLRPLALGLLGERYCVASESCAFDIIGAKLPARGPAGRDGVADRARAQTRQVVEGERRAFCVFEHIYFARPDSRLEGRVVQTSRGRMGEILAARGAGRRRPGDPGARLRQRRRARLRAGERAAAGRRARSRTATSRARSSSPGRSCASTACG